MLQPYEPLKYRQTEPTFTTGARQFVVQEAAVTMWSLSAEYSSCRQCMRGRGSRLSQAQSKLVNRSLSLQP